MFSIMQFMQMSGKKGRDISAKSENPGNREMISAIYPGIRENSWVFPTKSGKTFEIPSVFFVVHNPGNFLAFLGHFPENSRIPGLAFF